MTVCELHRDPTTGEVDYVQAQYADLAGLRARGIDIGANYRFPIGKGNMRLGFSGTARTLHHLAGG